VTYPSPDLDPRAQRASDRAIRKAQRPWFKKKRFILPLALVLLLVVIGISTSGGTAPTAAPATGGAAVASAPAAADPGAADPGAATTAVPSGDDSRTLAYGKTFDESGLQLVVQTPKRGDDTLGATYCASVSYVNGGDATARYSLFDWKMADSDGTVVDPTFSGAGTGKALNTGELRPGGGKVSGLVCFPVQGSGTPTEVIYQGGLFSQPVTWRK
jgi:hypothetical protein